MRGRREELVVDERLLGVVVRRISLQVAERYFPFGGCVLVAIQPRGVPFAERLVATLKELQLIGELVCGRLDPTLYRDDIKTRGGVIMPAETFIPESIDGRTVILVDDVIYTGRTVRAALDALMRFGRPQKVELVVLVDRRFSREVPIEATIKGISVDAARGERVRVCWQEPHGKEGIWLITEL